MIKLEIIFSLAIFGTMCYIPFTEHWWSWWGLFITSFSLSEIWYKISKK